MPCESTFIYKGQYFTLQLARELASLSGMLAWPAAYGLSGCLGEVGAWSSRLTPHSCVSPLRSLEMLFQRHRRGLTSLAGF